MEGGWKFWITCLLTTLKQIEYTKIEVRLRIEMWTWGLNFEYCIVAPLKVMAVVKFRIQVAYT